MNKAAIFLLALLLTFSFSFAEHHQTVLKIKQSQLLLTFVQTAKSGILKKIKNTNQFYLTLYGVTPYIRYISKRPNRVTGNAPFKNFIKAWTVGENNFKNNPPNAILTAAKINSAFNNGSKHYLVTLSSPIYNAKQSAARYTVTPIGTQKILIGEIKLDAVTLVID